MKKLILILLAASLSASAQNCSPIVTINCDSTLHVVASVPPSAVGTTTYFVEFDGLNAPADVQVAANPVTGGVNIVTSTSISPSFSQYSVTVSPIQGGYPCNSTTIVNQDALGNPLPAKIGYTYQYGTIAYDAGLNCSATSSARFLDSTGKGGRWKGNGKSKRWSKQ